VLDKLNDAETAAVAWKVECRPAVCAAVCAAAGALNDAETVACLAVWAELGTFDVPTRLNPLGGFKRDLGNMHERIHTLWMPVVITLVRLRLQTIHKHTCAFKSTKYNRGVSPSDAALTKRIRSLGFFETAFTWVGRWCLRSA
jgi:hypothetical protein